MIHHIPQEEYFRTCVLGASAVSEYKEPRVVRWNLPLSSNPYWSDLSLRSQRFRVLGVRSRSIRVFGLKSQSIRASGLRSQSIRVLGLRSQSIRFFGEFISFCDSACIWWDLLWSWVGYSAYKIYRTFEAYIFNYLRLGHSVILLPACFRSWRNLLQYQEGLTVVSRRTCFSNVRDSIQRDLLQYQGMREGSD